MEQKTRFEILPSAHNPLVTILKIDGFVDVNAAPEFDAALLQLRKQERFRILLDMSGVTYLSSAGMGVIVGSLQDFREHTDGDIKLLNISDKIMKVLQSIGLHYMVDFLETEAAVLHWSPRKLFLNLASFRFSLLDPNIESGRPFNLRIEALTEDGQPAVRYQGEPQVTISDGLIYPKELKGFAAGVWEGTLMTTGTGALRLTIQEGEKASFLNFTAEEPSPKAQFPCEVACNFCRTAARARGMGIYRCQNCQEIFYVDAWAHVITLKGGSPLPPKRLLHKTVEIKINSDINYLTSLRRFLSGLCEQENLPEAAINETVLATEEVLLNIIEHSYDFDPLHVMDVRLKIRPEHLEIRIRDRGKPFDITQHKNLSLQSVIQKRQKGGLGAVMINALMDKVTYRTYKHYNQLVMIKYRTKN